MWAVDGGWCLGLRDKAQRRASDRARDTYREDPMLVSETVQIIPGQGVVIDRANSTGGLRQSRLVEELNEAEVDQSALHGRAAAGR